MTRTTTSPTSSPTSRARRAAVALALVAGLGLTACGEQESDSAEEPSADESTSTPAEEPGETSTEDPSEEPQGPACAEVWVAGATLPQKYTGCQDADKEKWVEAMVYRCSSGQQLVTYGTTFYAAKGEVVNESQVPLRRNRDFQKVLASCGA